MTSQYRLSGINNDESISSLLALGFTFVNLFVIGQEGGMAAKEKKKFEEAVEELERVVEQLESGELSLEDSLAAFENGVRLVKLCNQKLTEVERKIELLVKDKDGKLQLKPLEDLGEDDVNEKEK